MARPDDPDGITKRNSPKRARAFRVLGERLRALRLARGWLQREAAERAGVSDRFIRKAEAGGPIELQSVSLLAQLYGSPETPLSPQELLAEPLVEHSRNSPQGEALVRRWFEEVWNQGRLETIEELIAPECTLRAEGMVVHGPVGIRQRTEMIRAAFSDFDLRMEQVTVHGDWVVSRWRVTMTHTGDWMGNPPTHKRVTAYGSTWIRVQDGVFVEGWDYWEQQQATDAVRSQDGKPS